MDAHLLDDARAFLAHACSIDQHEWHSRNTNGALQHIAGRSGFGCHDRRIIGQQRVEKRRFPCIGRACEYHSDTIPQTLRLGPPGDPADFRDEIFSFIGQTGRKACDIILVCEIDDSFDGSSQPEDPAAPFFDAL